MNTNTTTTLSLSQYRKTMHTLACLCSQDGICDQARATASDLWQDAGKPFGEDFYIDLLVRYTNEITAKAAANALCD